VLYVLKQASAEKGLHLEFGVQSVTIQLGRQRLDRDGRPRVRWKHMNQTDLRTIFARDRRSVRQSLFRNLRKIGREKDVLDGDTLF
jgi:hypothetical protein